MGTSNIPHRLHVLGQPEGASVVWGCALSVDQPGDFADKPVHAGARREIMTDLLGRLHTRAGSAAILDACTCVPCLMPFVTSQSAPRSKGDRPPVLPSRTRNLAFIGQFVGAPQGVVSPVERSAQAAVQGPPRLRREAPPVHQGQSGPRVLRKAFRALHEVRA